MNIITISREFDSGGRAWMFYPSAIKASISTIGEYAKIRFRKK